MHKIGYFEAGQFEHFARCRCGFTTPRMKTRQQVEDEVRKHEKFIERIRLHLGRNTVSLKATYDYYVQMANDPNVEGGDRVLWQRLAEELGPRVKDKSDTSEDQELPFG